MDESHPPPTWTSGLGGKILVGPIMLLVADMIRLPHHHSLGVLQLPAIDRANLPTLASLQETHIGTKPCSDGRWRQQRNQRVDLDSESSLLTFGLLSPTFHTEQEYKGWHAAKPVGIRNWVFREKSKSLFLIGIHSYLLQRWRPWRRMLFYLCWRPLYS